MSVAGGGSDRYLTPASESDQCEGPPVPENYGAGELTEKARRNAETAKWLAPGGFYEKVRLGGDWDLKQWDSDLEDFGNYHYGYVGRAAGFSQTVLLRMAGWA